MDRQLRDRHQLEEDLRTALQSGEIGSVYQPCFNIQTGEVVGFEAAPHWVHPAMGEIPAERFIPIAEEAGLIHELAARLMREACAAAARWPAHAVLALELYPSQLKDRSLKERMLAILAECGLPPQRLEIAITESALVQDLEGAQHVLGGLREAGVKVALDNFGTGYSSLYHLRNFKLDKIKIDRSFIESMNSTQESAAIVNALVGLGGGLGLTVAAEGIDNAQQQALLLRSGCQQGQGHLYSDAVSAEASTAFFDSPIARLALRRSSGP
jgi:EAL domain-containing protein (putative c-di-GMP-specific phosphodiesterase class I)